MLLGLPYAISDKHFTVTFTDDPAENGHCSRSFAIQLGMLTGRVIDQVQSRNGPRLSEVVNIEDELETLAGTKTASWWDVSLPSSMLPAFVDDLRERLMCQIQYFLTKVYLHLPYLLKAPSSTIYHGEKVIVVDAARQLVKIYHVLRSCIDGEPIFDCQSLDFVGFMGAVVIVMGLIHSFEATSSANDLRLIDQTIQLLQTVACSGTNQLAQQCQITLRTLLSLCHPERRQDFAVPPKIRIPYFGVLSVIAKEKPHHHNTQTAGSYSTLPVSSSGEAEGFVGLSTRASNDDTFTDLPSIAYQGLYSFDYDMDWAEDNANEFPNPWNLTENLEQEWECFLNGSVQ